MFMVGVALPFSIASRKAKGHGFKRMLGHALWRSLVLILLGIFLRSVGHSQTNWMFTDVLGQIGLGYTFLFLFAWLEVRWQVVAAAGLLVGDWLLFATYPLPKPGFAWITVGVPVNWPYHLHGFAAHWDKNTNVAAAFDKWFLNLFPREKPFKYEGGGYETLNFIPSLATMTFGLLAGGLLRSERPQGQKVGYLMAGAVAVGALGTALDYFGLCPIVKRIWTPAWALYAAGWTGVTLALFYLVIDVVKLRKWALPLVVVGMNSIAMYVMAHVTKPFVFESLRTHFGRFFDDKDPWVNVKLGAATLFILWLVCLWMWRKKVFIKV
jgi:predicted acyltransferase